MIPEQNTFWLSEKTESVIYVIDRYYEGTMGETRECIKNCGASTFLFQENLFSMFTEQILFLR